MSKGLKKESERLRRELVQANKKIELLQSELNQLNRISELVKDLVIITDIKGVISNSSLSLERILGYKLEDFTGKKYQEFVHPADRIAFNVYFKKVTTDNTTSLLHRFRTRNKKYIWIEAICRLHENDGTLKYFYVQDLSERKKLQNDLIISHKRYKSLVENLPFVIFRYNSELKNIYVSPNVSDLLPFEPEELTGTELDDLGFDPDKVDFFKKSIREVFDGGKKIEKEFEQETQKGLLVLNWKIVPEFDEQGRVITVLGIFENITQEKKNYENALLYKQIYNNNEDGIAILDTKGNFREINSAYQGILGYNINDLKGKNSSVFLGEKTYSEIFRVFEFQSIFEGELKAITRDEEDLYLDLIMFPVKSDNTTLFLVQIIRDITQRKNNERSLIEAKRKAEEADQLKTAFLSNMSHEIRTPMNSILGFASLLENPDISVQQRKKYIDFISKNGKSLLNLIGDIIDIAKIESNQLRINNSPCNLNDLMEDLRESLNKVKDIEGKDSVEIRTSYKSNVPLVLLTDCYRLRQVLVNLIYNAIKFTTDGHVEFGFIVNKTNEILFHVKDTGIGIKKEMQDRIFERFHKLENSKEKLYGGAGLGLAISSQLVRILGGRIWLESYPDKGSSFYFTIPYKGISQEERKMLFFKNDTIAYHWEDKKLLVVENDLYSLELLKEYLDKTGISIIHAETGKKAVSIFTKTPDIDLIIMDIQLPEMNGIEAAGLIREINSEVPIIAQTAFGMDEDKEMTGSVKFEQYLIKPVERNDLLKIMSYYLNR